MGARISRAVDVAAQTLAIEALPLPATNSAMISPSRAIFGRRQKPIDDKTVDDAMIEKTRIGISPLGSTMDWFT